MIFSSVKLSAGSTKLLLALAAAAILILVTNRNRQSGAEPNHNADQRSADRAPRERNSRISRHSASDSRNEAARLSELQSIENLARTDHDAAIKRLDSYVDQDLRFLALTAVARGWAASDPQSAAKWVEQLEPESHSISAALGLIPAWAAQNADECLAWAKSLAEGNLREVSLTHLADAWVAIDPQRAVNTYFSLKPEPGSEAGLHVIVSQWALDAPEAAVNYFTQSTDLARREEFLETALVSLTNKNPALVWNKANEGFSDPARILNVQAMALEAMAETDPVKALQLAESVGNDSELLKGIARGWSFSDKPAAKEWISRITDPELAELLTRQISPH